MKTTFRSVKVRKPVWVPAGTCMFHLLLMAGAAAAEDNADSKPTFSIEAIAVNGVNLPAPSQEVTVGPGARITAKMFVRDWSVNNEKLRSYQTELAFESFQSGEAGSIKPTRYDRLREIAEENPDAAFIDKTEESFVHHDKLIIPIVDTLNAQGYRWLSVLLDPAEGLVSKQDGTKYYLATVELTVSDDAEGLFTIAFVEEPYTTGLLDEDNQPIIPVFYEPLKIQVSKEMAGLLIRESDPPSGAIDARMAFDPTTARVFDLSLASGWKSITITFNGDASEVKAGDFTVRDGTPRPPQIERVEASSTQVILTLNKGIHPGRITTINYKPTNGMVRLSYLPGDVNNDGVVDNNDIIALAEVLSGKIKLPNYQTDINRSGTTDAEDMVALVELIHAGWARNGLKISGQ